jgi:SNF2 family DNA or RNA helicase
MFQLTESEIIYLCGGTHTFFKGKKYYNSSRVRSIEYNPDINGFVAIVSGNFRYRIKIYFDDTGNFEDASCTCPAQLKYPGYCKHIVAVLLKLKNERSIISKLVENKRREGIKSVINYFSYITPHKKNPIPINLEINYEFTSEYNEYNSKVNFKIGEEKLYVLKNLKKFIDSMKKNEPLQFGKSFTFLPEIHYFRKEDQPLIDMIVEKVEHEEQAYRSSWGYGKSSIFNGKNMLLSPTSLKRLFKIMGKKEFNVIIDRVTHKDISIVEEDLPLGFKLIKDKNNMLLKLEGHKDIIALVEDGSYFYFDNKIYNVSNEQQKYFIPLFNSLGSEDTLFIHNDYNERFVSEVLPFIVKIGNLSIDKKVEELIYKPEFKSEIYLDKKGENITAEIKYIYGDISINPFIDNYNDKQDNNWILVRNMEKEGQIISLIEDAEFKVSSENIYLEGDEKTYKFIVDIIPQLNQLAEVYYSDAFKNIKIYNQSSLSAKIRLNDETDILEFSFNIEEIDKVELADVFRALQERKKFYRLKKGGFLPLSLGELDSFSNLMDYLRITPEDISKDKTQIPKYRALYLDEVLKETKIKNINRNIAFKQLIQNIKEPSDIDYDVPEKFSNVLREYQVTGFKWLKTLSNYKMGGILADDMGLGKTIQVLTLLTSEKIEKGLKPSLVIAPTSLVYNWLAEVTKFAPDLKTLVISGTKDERQQSIDNLLDYDLIITSYPLIRRDIELYDIIFRYCILDEAQHIKNPVSQNASSVKKIKAENYFALTGTPIENSLTELWSIFDFIMPGYLLSHGKFVKNYEKTIMKDDNEEALEQLKKQIAPFILRRMKKEVLKELPDKIENKMMVELTKEQKLVYLSYFSKIKGEIDNQIKENGFGSSHIKILAGLTRLRQICCHPALFLENYDGGSGKLELLQEVLEESLQGGHRILLFSQFTSMLKIIKNYLEHQAIEYFYLDGSTETKLRGEMVNRYNKGERSIFLISLKAGGTGLNLTGADTIIHFDPWWNPAVEDQATDRAHRIGQENIVHVIKLYTKGTIEEKIFNIQEKKKRMIESIVKPGETMISKLTEDEIRDLFE